MLVSFEGIDGSGKSTAIKLVAPRLRKKRMRVVVTQEPTKTWLGRVVRQGIRKRLDALALAGLFLADRSLHMGTVMPALKTGAVVLTDRYVDSTTAYQAAALDPRIPGALDGLWRLQNSIFPKPALVVLFDLKPEESLRRIQGRRIKEPFERARFLERVRNNYLTLAKRDLLRWTVLDARRPKEELADLVTEAILARKASAAATVSARVP